MDPRSLFDGSIVAIDPDRRPRVVAVDRDGQKRLITTNENFASPVAVDLAPGPRLFVADSFGIENRDCSIISVDPANGSQRLVAAGVLNERDDSSSRRASS